MFAKSFRKSYSQSPRRERNQGVGPGKGHNKPNSGLGGKCICPKRKHEEIHVAGHRCINRTCPKWGTKLIRL